MLFHSSLKTLAPVPELVKEEGLEIALDSGVTEPGEKGYQ